MSRYNGNFRIVELQQHTGEMSIVSPDFICPRISNREHLGQRLQNTAGGRIIDFSQHSDQSSFIHRSYPVEHDLSLFALKGSTHPRWISPACRCHRSDDDCPDMPVHLIRGDYETGPCLFDFMSESGIKIDQADIEPADYHRHSSRSQSDSRSASLSSRASSPLRRIFLKDFSQSALGFSYFSNLEISSRITFLTVSSIFL